MTNTITFDLEVVTSRTPTAFVQALFERIDVVASVQMLEGIKEITTPNFQISAFDGASDALSQELCIEPTVFIQFRPKPTLETPLLAIKRLLEAMDKWLHAIPNDFVMIYNGEAVMMYRKDGLLTLNRACTAWTPARTALITYPYTEADMPAITDVVD